MHACLQACMQLYIYIIVCIRLHTYLLGALHPGRGCPSEHLSSHRTTEAAAAYKRLITLRCTLLANLTSRPAAVRRRKGRWGYIIIYIYIYNTLYLFRFAAFPFRRTHAFACCAWFDGPRRLSGLASARSWLRAAAALSYALL